MTAPAPHGYPDFGRYVAGADKLIADLVVPDIDAVTVYGPYFIGDVSFVRVFFDATTNHFTNEVAFYEDAAMTVPLGGESWSQRQGDQWNQAIPTLGPYMVLSVTPSGVNSVFDARIHTAHALWRPSTDGGRVFLPFNNAAAVHPAGITNLEAGEVIAGPAVFHGHCATANTRMNLQGVTAGGTVFHLTRIDNIDGIVSRPLFLPPMHLRLVIDNGSGAAATFMYAVTVQYGGVH